MAVVRCDRCDRYIDLDEDSEVYMDTDKTVCSPCATDDEWEEWGMNG